MNTFKKITDVRSPLWQLLALCLFYPIAMLIVYRHETAAPAQLSLIALGILTLLVAIYICFLTIRTNFYNRKHPANKIDVWGITPVELKEEDEGMKMVTAHATRQTYVYNSAAIPLLALALIFLPHTVYIAITGVVILSMGHYLTYWRYIWRAL